MAGNSVRITQVLTTTPGKGLDRAEMLGCAMNVATGFMGLGEEDDASIAVTPAEFIAAIRKARTQSNRRQEILDLEGISEVVQDFASKHPEARIVFGWDDTLV